MHEVYSYKKYDNYNLDYWMIKRMYFPKITLQIYM